MTQANAKRLLEHYEKLGNEVAAEEQRKKLALYPSAPKKK